MKRNGKEASPHGTRLKRVHSRSRLGTVMYRRLRNGTLDVDLTTGKVTGHGGRGIKGRIDRHGYRSVELSLQDSRCKDRNGRRRQRQTAFVHRIVMMKKKAVEAREEFYKTESSRLLTSWRDFVKELPSGVDVDHKDDDRTNNSASNLQLKTEKWNRAKNPGGQTKSEDDAIVSYYESDF